jgi:hypothetical protein
MLRDNAQRAQNAIALFWVFFGITVIGIVSSFMEYNLAQKALTGFITQEEASSNDTRQLIIRIVALIVQIILIVYFIMWFRRAYFNLHSLRCYVRYSEGWAAGAWFVPFLNLVRPYEIMKDIWDRTQERTQEGIEDKQIESSSIVGFWWFFWIAANIAANIFTWRYLNRVPNANDVIAKNEAAIIIDVVNLINLFLIINIIKKISGFEEKLKDIIAVENIASEESASPVLVD